MLVVSCHVKENQLHKKRYGEWLVLHQVLAIEMSNISNLGDSTPARSTRPSVIIYTFHCHGPYRVTYSERHYLPQPAVSTSNNRPLSIIT